MRQLSHHIPQPHPPRKPQPVILSTALVKIKQSSKRREEKYLPSEWALALCDLSTQLHRTQQKHPEKSLTSWGKKVGLGSWFSIVCL